MRTFGLALAVSVPILLSGCGGPTCSEIWQQREDLNADYRANSAWWSQSEQQDWDAKFKKLTDEVFAKDCSGPGG